MVGKDSFFTIYKVEGIGILFYNHKTKNFYLFIQAYYYDDEVNKILKWLCGFNGSLGDNHLLYPRSIGNPDPNKFKYYLTFESSKKKLYSVRYNPKIAGGLRMDGLYDSHVSGSEEKIEKIELTIDPHGNPNIPPTDNNSNEITIDNTSFTLVKAFGNETSDNDYFSENWSDFNFSDKAKLKTALERAYEASDMIESIRKIRDGDDDDY